MTGGVEAVDRALRLLEIFDAAQNDFSLAELARISGEHKSTILRITHSLEKFGYLTRLANGRYALGPTLARLGARAPFDLAQHIQPILNALCAQTQETVSFYIREGEERVVLLRAEPARSIKHALTIGARMPLGRGASGKVLRAFADEGEPEVRAQGYALTHGERDPEVAGLSVPVFDRSGQLRGALALSGLVTRFTPERVAILLPHLKSAQKQVTF